jgi:hypothetical protein
MIIPHQLLSKKSKYVQIWSSYILLKPHIVSPNQHPAAFQCWEGCPTFVHNYKEPSNNKGVIIFWLLLRPIHLLTISFGGQFVPSRVHFRLYCNVSCAYLLFILCIRYKKHLTNF